MIFASWVIVAIDRIVASKVCGDAVTSIIEGAFEDMLIANPADRVVLNDYEAFETEVMECLEY